MKRLIALSALVAVAGCEDKITPQTVAAYSPAEVAAPPEPEITPAVELTSADKGRVCRAAVGSLNGRDPAIIRVISTQGDIHRVRYTRDDGTVWTNECRVGATTAEWRMVENGQPGRWRTEDTIRFTLDGPTVSINTFMGGEPVTSDTYTIEN